MKEKKESKGWLFVCFVPSEKAFICHTVANFSFFKAKQEHAAIFPNHAVVFTLQVPMYLAEYISKELQYFFLDSEKIYKDFAKCVNNPMTSLVVSKPKTYEGFIPLAYSDLSKRFGFAQWNGEYYESAQAFVLDASLLEFFNSLFFIPQSNNVLSFFKNGIS